MVIVTKIILSTNSMGVFGMGAKHASDQIS